MPEEICRNFVSSKLEKSTLKPPKAPSIIEVIWSPHFPSWIKVNTDRASTKNPVKASARGIFRNSEGICIGCFSPFLGNENALFAELVAAITTIEIAHQ